MNSFVGFRLLRKKVHRIVFLDESIKKFVTNVGFQRFHIGFIQILSEWRKK